MKKAVRKILIIVGALMLLMLLIFNISADMYTAQDNMRESSLRIFSQVQSIMRSSAREIASEREEVNKICLQQARNTAQILSKTPSEAITVPFLQEMVDLLYIDEICIFDESGTIVLSSVPEYVGMSVYDGEQIAFFIPMLSDKKLELLQDLMPNTKTGKMMQYAAVWMPDGKSFVQIGFNPENVLALTRAKSISEIFSLLTDSSEATLLALDSSSFMITASTEPDLVGKNITDLGIDPKKLDNEKKGIPFCTEDGSNAYGVFEKTVNGPILGRFVLAGNLYDGIVADNLRLLLYLLALIIIIFLVLSWYLDKKILSSINKINTSLQLISAGNIDTRVSVDSTPEFVQMSSYINEMVNHLHSEWSAYSKALMSRSEYSYFADLTDNVIRKAPIYKNGDQTLGRAKTDYPVCFDTYLDIWHNGYNITPIDSSFDLNTTYCNALLERYAKGERIVEYDFMMGENKDFRRKTILLDENHDGHIIATTIISNMDELRIRELEMKADLEAAYLEAKRANQAKSDFLSRMSHDIRTPMNGIIGMTKIAKEHQNDPARVRDCLSKIEMSSSHLLTLINDILELSRIESGKVVLANEPANLEDIYNTCISVLESSTADRKLDISVNVRPIPYPYVYTDSLRMRQVILNILSNSVKYTPDGRSVSLLIETEAVSEKQLISRITVSDTGIGMSEAFLKHIFEPFSQEDEFNARTTYKGTGLGMAIVKDMMDLFKGTIDITSEPDKGTTVVLTFPLERAEAPAASESSSSENPIEDVDLNGLHILLAEDNELNREIAEELLSESGLILTTAVDGQDAVDIFNASPVGTFACIFMDIMMPNLNGYEATMAIREMARPDAETIPIIAMTANAFAEDMAKSKAAGMNDHLSKPIEIDKVLLTLKKYVKKG
ncbi:MAG: response regulator [Eubacterium sp.]|nr:response regulator [Eubacterium sp.]